MPNMTKAQAKKRLNEAKAKVMNVWSNSSTSAVTFADMGAIEKIIDKCLKRLN